MAWLERDHVKIYYEDIGQGEPIITSHGLMEDSGYWGETGVAAKLAERNRIISMDIRGHGRTIVDGEPFGYDVSTMGNDFSLLADGLGLDRFHILTHATGGMAAVRFAMTTSSRLISLMLTDTGSATAPAMPGVDKAAMRQAFKLGAEARKTATVEEWMKIARAEPGPFLFKMAEHPDSQRMWTIYENFLRRSNPAAISDFMMRFYSDPDPMIEGLRQIKCPTLVLLGEFDIVFLEPSRIMAQEIADVRHVLLDGIGHMTAIEDPERTASQVLGFLETVRKTGKAN